MANPAGMQHRKTEDTVGIFRHPVITTTNIEILSRFFMTTMNINGLRLKNSSIVKCTPRARLFKNEDNEDGLSCASTVKWSNVHYPLVSNPGAGAIYQLRHIFCSFL